MQKGKFSEISREKFLAEAKKLATPMNFDALIKGGVLEKAGAWYLVKDWDRLPDHAKAKIYSITSEGKVKFRKATKSAANLVKKLSR